jgi:hypothetical protein
VGEDIRDIAEERRRRADPETGADGMIAFGTWRHDRVIPSQRRGISAFRQSEIPRFVQDDRSAALHVLVGERHRRNLLRAHRLALGHQRFELRVTECLAGEFFGARHGDAFGNLPR